MLQTFLCYKAPSVSTQMLVLNEVQYKLANRCPRESLPPPPLYITYLSTQVAVVKGCMLYDQSSVEWCLICCLTIRIILRIKRLVNIGTAIKIYCCFNRFCMDIWQGNTVIMWNLTQCFMFITEKTPLVWFALWDMVIKFVIKVG